MSDDADSQSKTASPSSPAINVDFSAVSNHAESSSKAESRRSNRSSGKRSSGSPSQDGGHLIQRDDSSPQSRRTDRIDGSAHKNRRSGGFLLDSVFANGPPRGSADANGKRKAQDGQLQVDKRRVGGNRVSRDSSLRGSPLSREVSMNDGPTDERNGQNASRPPSMDATQLVQMALNLSESRKRHVSNTLRVPSGSERSIAPAFMPNVGTVRASSASRQRSSQYANEKTGGSEGSEKRSDLSLEQPVSNAGPGSENVFYTFSPATLARAEKARKYLELGNEYRRLLQTLPPLKPNTSNELGRAYNPIQSLRNRRIRIREKRPFPAPPETWTDVDRVSGWVNDVESAAFMDYDDTDEDLQVPPFEGEYEAAKGDSQQHSTARHRRTDTVASVISRPENSWTIEPTELLADVYWTEHGDNKAYIETRKGSPVFPARERYGVSTPRISVDRPRGKNDDFELNDIANDFEESGRPTHRRRLMIPGGERLGHRRLVSRASSSSSESSKRRRSGMPLTSRSDENIGPLERHMEELIAKDEKGELTSPETSSPEQWTKYKPFPTQRTSVDNAKRESFSRHHARPSVDSSKRGSFGRPEGRGSLEVPREFFRRSRSADGRVGSVDLSTSSADDVLGSEPVSPQVSRNIPSMGMDLSLPSETRRRLDGGRPRGPTLPSFRSTSKERNKIGQTDFADSTGSPLSPILSAGSHRPIAPEELPSFEDFRRQRTNDSGTGLHRIDTRGTMGSSKDSGSTVGRFLRTRRDRIFKTRERIDANELSAGVSDLSETDDSPKVNGKLRRRASDDRSDGSVRGSVNEDRPRPKYTLPSFTSSARDRKPALKLETPGLLKDGPISQPSKQQDKPDRSVNPIINLPDATASDTELAITTSQESRKGYGDLRPLFGELPSRRLLTGASAPGISQSKRHWSIYDKAPVQQDVKVTSKDIARVKALLLSSGIKAREISRRANKPRTTTPTFLTDAASTADKSLGPVPLKEEHLVAARMLADYLSSSLSEFEGTLTKFRDGPAKQLGSQLEDLRQRAADHLSNIVHETSDEADAFTIELNTKTPQSTKRVDDAVDEMLRRRRRQLRWLRITGYKLLEWLVLGILWWIWFLVAVFNIGRRVVVAIWRFFYWLFVF